MDAKSKQQNEFHQMSGPRDKNTSPKGTALIFNKKWIAEEKNYRAHSLSNVKKIQTRGFFTHINEEDLSLNIQRNSLLPSLPVLSESKP